MIDQKIEPKEQDLAILRNRNILQPPPKVEVGRSQEIGIQTEPLDCLPALSEAKPVVQTLQYQTFTPVWVPYYFWLIWQAISLIFGKSETA